MNRIKFDGRVHSVNGIRYRYSLKSHILSLYIDDIPHKKKKIRADINPDVNHQRPHIHIKEHEASFDIKTGELLVGKCNARTRKVVKDWIFKHKEDLLLLWDALKEGKKYTSILSRIRGESSSEGEHASLQFNQKLLDALTIQAKESPRLRQAYDFRTTPEDNSQRMLIAMEPGTVLPIHRHRGSTETVVVLRGKVRQNFYDENGQLTESFEVSAGSGSTPSINSGTGSPQIVGFSVELGRWHNTECLESGTVILECKDGKPFDKLKNNEALGEEDIMNL